MGHVSIQTTGRYLGCKQRIPSAVNYRNSTGWNEAQGRAGAYTFTNGVISTTLSVQQNAITASHALFLPEPRVGMAWNVFGNGRTSVTIGAGLHHSVLDALDYRLDQAAPFNTVYSYASTTVVNPTSGRAGISFNGGSGDSDAGAAGLYVEGGAADCAVDDAFDWDTTYRVVITRS